MLRSHGPGWACCLLGGLLLLSFNAHAQSGDYPASTYESEYLKRLKSYQTITPYGETPFGESIDLATGQVSFSQTDILLEGNGPAIRVSRSRSPEIYDASGVGPAQVFGDWSLDIPRISTLVASPRGSEDGGSPGANWGGTSRCTNFGYMTNGSGGIALEDWWHGYEVVMPDGASQPLLKRDAAYATKPAGATAYPVVTLGDVQMSCLAATKNGEAGQAFLAIGPDGTRYWFDWLVGVKAYEVSKQSSDVSALSGEPDSTEPDPMEPGDPTPTPMIPPDGDPFLRQPRMHAAMYVTRIEDRFGNFVTYNYNAVYPTRLDSIVASDGRKVSFTWSGLTLVSATAQPDTPADARTWRYEYAGGKLASVVLPDDSRWTFALGMTGAGSLPDMFASSCTKRYNANAPASDAVVSTITAPSGLVGSFTMRHRWHARSYANSACVSMPAGGGTYEANPPLFENLSLVQRTLSGPGVSAQTWSYTYGPAQASANRDTCAATQACPDTSYVDVTEPDGARTRYTHATRDGVMEGKLVRTDVYESTGALLRTETTQYPTLASLPFQARLGEAVGRERSNTAKMEHRYPMVARWTIQQGRSFQWAVPATCGATANQWCFDAFGRATRTVKTSEEMP
jgi:hypothetical protein